VTLLNKTNEEKKTSFSFRKTTLNSATLTDMENYYRLFCDNHFPNYYIIFKLDHINI